MVIKCEEKIFFIMEILKFVKGLFVIFINYMEMLLFGGGKLFIVDVDIYMFFEFFF